MIYKKLISKKTAIASIVIVIVLAGYLVNQPNEDHKKSAAETELPKSSSNQNSLSLSATKESIDETNDEALSFERQPFPQITRTRDECMSARSSEAFQKHQAQILQLATQAYFAGSSKEAVADGIWAKLGWYNADDWYGKALAFEVINRDLPQLEAVPSLQEIVNKLTEFNAELASGIEINKIVDLTSMLEQLWTEIDLERVNRPLLLGEPVETVLARIDESLAHVPEIAMRNTHLSPVIRMIPSIVSSKRVDVAIALLKKYPNFSQSNSQYGQFFRQNVIASLNFELDSDKMRNDVNELLSLLQFGNQPLVVFELPYLFDRLRLKEVLQNLESQNVSIPYTIMNDREAPKKALAFTYDDHDYQLSQDISAECNLPNDWIASRNKSATQWKAFKNDPFISEVRESFEYAYCEANEQTLNVSGISEAVRNSIEAVNQHLVQNNIKAYEIDFQTLKLPPMNDEARAVFSAMITRDLVEEQQLSAPQIIQRLSDANLVPYSSDINIMKDIIFINGVDIWLDEIELNDIPENYMLINKAAELANFKLFKKLKDGVNTEDSKKLDPFFFFIRGYQNIRFSGRSNIGVSSSSNKDFIEYFSQNGVRVESHHLRQSFKIKVTNEYDYKSLTESFPQLSVGDDVEYFAVRCF